MKKLILVTQSKGGVGKSVLTFLLAEKYPQARILDMDDATKTTAMQLAYRKPVPVTFLNSNNVIDRGVFNEFLEKLSTLKNELFIADLGASVSEQLPYYLEDVNEDLAEVLNELGIELEIYNVVGGSNMFQQTMTYLSDLNRAVSGQFKVVVFKNEHYDFAEMQSRELERYVKDNNLKLIPFTISKDKNESTQNRINEVLKSGHGIAAASPFSKMYFSKAIKTYLEPGLSEEVSGN